MKTSRILLIAAFIGLLALFAVGARAQSSTNAPNWLTVLTQDTKTFFTDNTNLFNQGTVAFEAGPVVNLSN